MFTAQLVKFSIGKTKMKRTGPSNPVTQELIASLRKESATSKSGIWHKVADDLEMPTRIRRVVNVSRIARCSKANDTIVVPGKVLGSGVLSHAVIVAALSFSDGARARIVEAKGKAISIGDLLKQKPKLSDVRVIG